jgi:LPS export ABC transporter permease LptF
MKIITRYIYKELTVSTLLGIVVFTFILILNSIFQIMDLAVNKGASLFVIARMLSYLTVTLLSITLPVSLLFAVLLTYGRFSEDNELVALRASGVSAIKFCWQPLALAAAVSAFLVWSNLSFAPMVQKDFSELYFSIARKQSAFKFENNTFIKMDDYRIHVDRVDKKTNVLSGVNIYRFSNESRQLLRVYASDGRVALDPEKGFTFVLTNGVIENFEMRAPDGITHFRFGKYTMTVPFRMEGVGFYSQTLREYTGGELLSEIKKYRENRLPAGYLEREYHMRWSIGTASFFLVLAGLPLGVLFHRKGKSTGFGLSLVVVSAYYFMLMGGITLADKGIMPPVPAVWLPNAVILAFGLALSREMFKV